jgi:probable HAF family extracellular repeat protein
MAPGCSYTEATGINSFGQIVGHGYVTLGPGGPAVQQRAFLRQPNGAITDLDIFGSTWAAANAVNDWGQVVGFYLDSHGAYHGFLTQPGGATPKDLGTFLVRGEPLAVNDLGQVVGYTTVIGESGLYYSQAFLYAQGKMHELGTSSGYSSSIAYGINNRGQVVGSAGTLSPPRLVVWVYLQGQMRDLNGLLSPAARGWTVEGASGINDLGQIIGTATFNNGNPHAVILTPRYW